MPARTPRSEWAINALHLVDFYTSKNKIYVFTVNDLGPEIPKRYQVMASWGKAHAARVQSNQEKFRCDHLHAALSQMDNLTRNRVKEGYVDIESPSYRGGLNLDKVLEMIDCTRMVGYAINNELSQVHLPSNLPSTSSAQASRAKRNINI